MKMKKLFFIVLFIGLSLLSYHLRLFHIKGSKYTFSLFSFLGPLPTAFIGPISGLIAIFLTEFIHKTTILTHISLFTFLRFFILPISSIYFTYFHKNKIIILIPLICMLLFLINPTGRASYVYTLYWLIPIILPIFTKNIFMRALSTTFVSHAMGSVMFLYLFDTNPGFWISLIPIVAIERLTFALGITISYILLVNILNILFKDELLIENEYVLKMPNINIQL